MDEEKLTVLETCGTPSSTPTYNSSSETIESRRQSGDIFKMLKEKKHLPKILHVAKLSFKSEGGDTRGVCAERDDHVKRQQAGGHL